MRLLTTLLVALPFSFALPQSTVDYATVQALSSKVSEVLNAYTALHNDLENLLNSAKPNLGNAASSLDQAQADWNVGFQTALSGLTRIGEGLNNLGANYQETENGNSGVWSR
jgi:uncharacterized protein YukE